MCVNSNYWNGSVHEGFMKKSDLIDIEDICSLIKIVEPIKVILTGHSMGGAVSSLIYLKLKFKFHGSDEGIELNRYEFFNFTFGAPMFGNIALEDDLRRKNWLGNMFHYAR